MSGNLCRCGAYPNIVAAMPRRHGAEACSLSAYHRAASEGAALALAAAHPDAAFIAGGTDLLQLFKQGRGRAASSIDISRLPLDRIEPRRRRVRIGALARMADVARHPEVRRASRRSPRRSRPARRRRCATSRPSAATSCSAPAAPTSAAPTALQQARARFRLRGPRGENRLHAIFGASPHCVATHASDLAVALLALDARVHVRRHEAARVLPIAELFRLPGDTPQRDSALEPGELIVAVEVPAAPPARSCYLKVRDRASFEFAVVSVAVALEVEGDVIRSARLAAGGVGTVPWRLAPARRRWPARRAEPAAFAAAAAHAADGAQPLGQNGFKIELLRRPCGGRWRTHKCLTQPPCHPERSEGPFLPLKGPSLGVTGGRRGSYPGATKPR